MCWRSSNAVRQIAEEDIKTFKVGIKYTGDSFISYYYNHEYIPLQKYEVHMCSTSMSGEVIVDTGFHSYNSNCCNFYHSSSFEHRLEVFYINKNYRKLLDWYSRLTYELLIAECIVPKGAEFYENEFGEIVSNQIIISNYHELS